MRARASGSDGGVDAAASATARVHGGADASGLVPWDFSTCANAAGPSPDALEAVRAADPTRYPDPHATAVRHALAELHGVDFRRVLPAASASEFIQRFTAVSGRLWPGAVEVPRHAYGDYALAAAAWGRPLQVVDDHDAGGVDGSGDDPCRVLDDGPRRASKTSASLRWFASPSSPLGRDVRLPWDVGAYPAILDAVYAPLRLDRCPGEQAASLACPRSDRTGQVFVLHSPNKALGLTGIRGAYAIAPQSAGYDVERCCQALEAAAPSWPFSAHAQAMLLSWATDQVQEWVLASLPTLAIWKTRLQEGLRARGFEIFASVTPHFVVRPASGLDPAPLRRHGVAVRDTTSFDLPGCWRVSAQPPSAQQALLRALDEEAGPALSVSTRASS